MTDDITFCTRGWDGKCSIINCVRHPNNIQHPELPHSYSDLYQTIYCPLMAKKENTQKDRVPLDKPLDYITWEDHQRVGNPLTIKTNILCPKCNTPLIKDKHIVLTTYPCKYRYFCEECGWTGTGF